MTGANPSGSGKRARHSGPATAMARLSFSCCLVFSAVSGEPASPPAAAPRATEEVANGASSCSTRTAAAKPLAADIGPKMVEFETSPFPYRGEFPGDQSPLLARLMGDRLGHTSPRGCLHW
jgi:hypothetical protein